ncbi:Bug family tripartite tricarboxylate transporter substrate binding protein [Candidimonas nitroreducens]|uniref:ABC transporter substrate-binding protein n=1 Tax=Candidimonas nitroreducens TaxID=683354 RepID=A0A225M8A2_9BURK|nr:tripartite tricarboxylate transporter substrate binding protein [Candidimonas nitroreducens]OWT57557.1 hypothetical protein CEY11_16805 [Candidimonas nitroreducens]
MNILKFSSKLLAIALFTSFSTAYAGPIGGNASTPISFVVPSSPGASSDVIARILGKAVTKTAGNPVIVENHPGANGIVGTQYVLNRKADGLTLLTTTSSVIVFNKFVFKKLPYDPQMDFEPLMVFARGTMMLGISPKLPYSTLPKLIEDAKKHPTKLNFGYATATQQLVGEIFQTISNTKFTFIAYKTNAAMLQAVITGEIDAAVSDPAGFASFIKSKKVNAVAVTAPKRLTGYPDTPTMTEQGIDFSMQTINGVFAKKGTPRTTRGALINVLKKSVTAPELRAYDESNAMDDFAIFGDEAQHYVEKMVNTTAHLVKKSGFQPTM